MQAQDPSQEEITPETIEQMTRIFTQAQELLGNFNQQSTQLRIVKSYNESATDMIPEDQIRNIMTGYEESMRQAQRQNAQLQRVLEEQFKQRDTLVDQMNCCLERLDKLEQRLRKKMKNKQQPEAKPNN